MSHYSIFKAWVVKKFHFENCQKADWMKETLQDDIRKDGFNIATILKYFIRPQSLAKTRLFEVSRLKINNNGLYVLVFNNPLFTFDQGNC